MRKSLILARSTALAVAAVTVISWAAANGVAHAAGAHGQAAATQAFPPLWDEPKDYEQALHRQLREVDARIQRGPFNASWQSLEAYRVPRWFRDAKFGIFIHWGIFSAPAFYNEWYSREMY